MIKKPQKKEEDQPQPPIKPVEESPVANLTRSDTMSTVSLTSEHDVKLEEPTPTSPANAREERSKEYVNMFLEKYVLSSRVDKDVGLYRFPFT